MTKLVCILTTAVLSVSVANAKVSNKKKVAAKKSNLTQEAVFDGATVNGKYLIAGGAVSEVEQEKTLNDIIGGRKDFKDRLKQDLAASKSQESKK